MLLSGRPAVVTVKQPKAEAVFCVHVYKDVGGARSCGSRSQCLSIVVIPELSSQRPPCLLPSLRRKLA